MYIVKRSILEISILTVITFGIYPFVWFFKTRNEINDLGGDIPTAWLVFLPFGNVYFFYKYCDSFAKFIKRDNLTLGYFLLMIITFFCMKNYIITGTASYNVLQTWTYTSNALFGYVANYMYLFIPMMVFQIGLNEFQDNQV